MTANRATQHQVNDAYKRAGILLHRGVPPEGVRLVLLRRGWSEEAADAIIADALAMLGLGKEAGRRLIRQTWIRLAITLVLVIAGAAALLIGRSMGMNADDGPAARTRASDAGMLVLLGCVLLIGAAVGNLVTLVSAARARWQVRHHAMGPIILLCMCGLAASVYGGVTLISAITR